MEERTAPPSRPLPLLFHVGDEFRVWDCKFRPGLLDRTGAMELNVLREHSMCAEPGVLLSIFILYLFIWSRKDSEELMSQRRWEAGLVRWLSG